ncbi:aromatic amino acid lyase, partial [uncultured Polaribacter sp.]|uniref:aromatic amino acid lyase n=1 Tax=uncultured Polaribacter sp. TaxID=174711 RepID=UPI0030DD19DD
MHTFHYIDSTSLDLTKIHEIISSDKKLVLSETAIQKIEKCRAYLDEKTKSISKPIYGINTGFGALYNVKIDDNNLQKLQEN